MASTIHSRSIFLLLCLTIHLCPSKADLWIDCHPEPNPSQQKCNDRGCIWAQKPVPAAPNCTFNHSDDPSKMAGYDASSASTHPHSRNGMRVLFKAKLQRRTTPTIFGDDFQKATVRIELVTNDIVRVLIQDQKGVAKRAKAPEWKRNLLQYGDDPRADPTLQVDVEEAPFGFAILRRSTGVRLIDTRRIPGLTFAEQYVQISARVPTQNVYGIGETTHDQLKHDFNYRKWGLLTRDMGPGNGDFNLYGVHAFYLCIDDDTGNSHGFFFLNTHAINAALQPDPENPQGGIITWRAIGGAIELFVFAGPTPDDVIRQYTSLIGRTQFPPYWALGFHLSRFGYRNLTFLSQIFQRNRKASIPQDTQVIDDDYMYQAMDFTLNPKTFGNLSGFVQELHDRYHMKLVLITDPAIASNISMAYAPLDQGLQANIFIRDNRTGKPIEGKVWPGNTYFPDFTHPNTSHWWASQIIDFHQRQDGIKFDGLWIDMNEPSNFGTGSLTGCAKNRYTQPPYVPLIDQDINLMTICLDSDQYAGKHYELHNLYGYGEMKATYKALQILFPTKRPFILSRSSFAGSGRYANHWSGDNRSQWRHIRLSIIFMLEFNLFGIPLVGSEICGFNDEATEELCTRWSQLGAFYPFSRNHNTYDAKTEQDPAAWSPNATAIIRDALRLRYGLLPYLYTLLYHAHVNGSAVARPLFYEYPSDDKTANIGDQFLWGSGLMVAPILDQGQTKRLVYFPEGRWYDLVRYTEVPLGDYGRALNIDMPINTVGLYIRGGCILPWQSPAVTTVESRRNDFALLVAFDEGSKASGSLYWDDGETDEGPFSYVQFEAWKQSDQGGIRLSMLKKDFHIEPKLGVIMIFGVLEKPSAISLDGQPVPEGSIIYNADVKTLRLSHLGIQLDRYHEIAWKLRVVA